MLRSPACQRPLPGGMKTEPDGRAAAFCSFSFWVSVASLSSEYLKAVVLPFETRGVAPVMPTMRPSLGRGMPT